ncbi:hypothetical protein J2I47_09705 [Fibrella sp. HMF5335]|uniref:YD repeat-containing protein n=1 Tax=Fibrella rubiginis TaxID=2817060 RepID=A0A939K161_9BACT|nr:hypothetical protein [Fibrella rubiginis]MBO0936817.1 hypothetical protein [Fibrella rubiginis]
MRHLSLLGWLSLVFVLSTALTCTDHRDQPAPRFRLKTVTYNQSGLSSNPYTLVYSENNQLMAYASSSGPIDFNNTRLAKQLSYSDNGVRQLVGFIDKINYYYVTYSYDLMKRVIRMSVYLAGSRPTRLLSTEDFTYDGSSTMPSSRLATTYSADGNMAVAKRTETYTFSGGNATSIDGNSYTYDTSPNPYKGLFGFSYFTYSSYDSYTYYDNSGAGNVIGYGINRPFSVSEEFSDSSVKVFNQNNRTTDAQLTYNSDGLVTKIVYKDGKSEVFTYESY